MMCVDVNNKLAQFESQKLHMAVLKLCMPLFKVTPVKAFLHMQIKASGECYLLSTHPSWIQALHQGSPWFQAAATIKTIRQVSSLMPFCELWSSSNASWQQIIKTMGLSYGLNIWQKKQDSIVITSFSGFSNDKHLPQIFVKNIKTFKLFAKQFMQYAKPLLAAIQSNPAYFNTTPLWFDNNQLDFIASFVEATPLKRFPIVHNHQQYELTQHQASCLSYLSAGKTAKESASLMQVSPRTVEKHIENIKILLDVHHKDQLISLYKESRELWL